MFGEGVVNCDNASYTLPICQIAPEFVLYPPIGGGRPRA